MTTNVGNSIGRGASTKGQVQDLKDGLELSELLFGEDPKGRAVLRAFDATLQELIDKMLQAGAVDELVAVQNQAVGILKALERMGGNIDKLRQKASGIVAHKSVSQSLNLHETLER